jgi:hypothetical protein
MSQWGRLPHSFIRLPYHSQLARLLWHTIFPIFDWWVLALEFLWSLVNGDERRPISPINGDAPDPVESALAWGRSIQVLSGDFLLPGRLTIENTEAYEESAERVARFASAHLLRYALGSHIELDVAASLYDEGRMAGRL